MKCLNLGCGYRFHRDWENVDFVATDPNVRVHDLREKTPYADGTFDVVYHSHVLEHFPKRAALNFLQECYRVLKPGGVIRVAVPDLERIARLYLEALGRAPRELEWAHNYDWMVMEMLDQCVREKSCGALIDYFQNPIPNWDFISRRMGAYGDSVRKALAGEARADRNVSSNSGVAWKYVLRNPGRVLRDRITKLLLSQKDWEALQVGRFRRSGEVHMWMYDAYSLGRLLKRAGFVEPRRVEPTESQIPGWARFFLDSDPDGRIYKADSMYMEAVRQ